MFKHTCYRIIQLRKRLTTQKKIIYIRIMYFYFSGRGPETISGHRRSVRDRNRLKCSKSAGARWLRPKAGFHPTQRTQRAQRNKRKEV